MNKITAKVSIPLNELKSRVQAAFENLVRERAQNRESIIKTEVGKYLKKVFNQTEVARSLRGKGTTDLAAELGLTDELAAGLADGMGDILANSVTVPPIGAGKVILRVQACPDNWGPYMSLPGASYVSKSATIPVMKWMLLNPKVDIGEAAYDIVYEGAGSGEWDKYIHVRSRSGRALMGLLGALKAKDIPFRAGGYVLPEILLGNAGKNFIQYAVSQGGVAEQAIKIALQILEG